MLGVCAGVFIYMNSCHLLLILEVININLINWWRLLTFVTFRQKHTFLSTLLRFKFLVPTLKKSFIVQRKGFKSVAEFDISEERWKKIEAKNQHRGLMPNVLHVKERGEYTWWHPVGTLMVMILGNAASKSHVRRWHYI